MAWDAFSVALLKQYAADGLSARKLAPLLPNGVSYSAVIGFCNRHKPKIFLRGNEIRTGVVMERLKADADKPKRAHRKTKPVEVVIEEPKKKLPVSTFDYALEAFRGVGRVSFLDRRDKECAWPLDTDLFERAPVMACGGPTVPAKPYCPYHNNLARGFG